MQYSSILPVLYVILSSILVILMRILQVEKDRSWSMACLSSIFGSIFLLPFLNLAQLSNKSEGQEFFLMSLLVLAGIFWSLMVLLEFKALKYNEASQNILLNCLETSLLAFLSWMVFKEEVSSRQVIGAVIIILSVVLLKFNSIKTPPRGIYLKLASIACSVIAICLDKYLVPFLGLSLVVFSGYFIPALMYIFCKPNNWRDQLVFENKSSIKIALLAILFYIVIGPIYVSAYSLGSLFSASTIAITKIAIVMLLGIYVLKEKDNLATKMTCASLSLIGIGFVLL